MLRLLLAWMLAGALGVVGYDWVEQVTEGSPAPVSGEGVHAMEGGQDPPPCCP